MDDLTTPKHDTTKTTAEPRAEGADVVVGRPPLEDFFGYLDGDLAGDRLRNFENYLARNREARRRLKQLARLESKMHDGLILDTILSDARARLERKAGTHIDETLIAAWIDGALTRDERAELATRLSDPAFAVDFYRQAQTARRAVQLHRRDHLPGDETGVPELPEGDPDWVGLTALGAALPTLPATHDADAGHIPPLAGSPPSFPPNDPATMGHDHAAADSSGDAFDSAWIGRLLIHSSAESLWVLDVAPRAEHIVPVQALPGGHFEVTVPFAGLNLRVRLRPAFRGVEMHVESSGQWAPLQFVLTDESGRRLHRADRVIEAPTALPALRPGVYRLMAPPTPMNLLVCVNGELGTTEIHQLRGGPY